MAWWCDGDGRVLIKFGDSLFIILIHMHNGGLAFGRVHTNELGTKGSMAGTWRDSNRRRARSRE